MKREPEGEGNGLQPVRPKLQPLGINSSRLSTCRALALRGAGLEPRKEAAGEPKSTPLQGDNKTTPGAACELQGPRKGEAIGLQGPRKGEAHEGIGLQGPRRGEATGLGRMGEASA